MHCSLLYIFLGSQERFTWIQAFHTVRICSTSTLPQRVLICRECQYAIQKSAISSHLLRHKIYREERQILLSYASQLDLLDPDHVVLPHSSSPAIGNLPIIPGFACKVDGCNALCASLKRIKRHQTEAHGQVELSNVENFARSVSLQAFFRGTKLRYFEVNSTRNDNTNTVSSTTTVHAAYTAGESDSYRQNDLGSEPSRHITVVPGKQIVSQSLPGPGVRDCTSSLNLRLDLEAMAYFHHFIMTTSHTLPCPPEHREIWKTQAVQQALKHEWIMCGLLTISANHVALYIHDSEKKQPHLDRSARYSKAFEAGKPVELRLLDDIAGLFADSRNDTAELGGEISWILQCSEWAMIGPDCPINSSHDTYHQKPGLDLIVSTLRWSSKARTGHTSVKSQEELFAQAMGILECHGNNIDSNLPGTSLLPRLRALPELLSQAYGRPDDARDVLVTLATIANLVVCCNSSNATRDVNTTRPSVLDWLGMIPEHFYIMLARDSPAALVLIAYWSILIKNAEEGGMWFFRNLSDMILENVDARLSGVHASIRKLVRGLV
ncbi:hypothetical protein FB567DRAFT_96485 [Paraphoma chrysanthemicola]|uniref:C2H2-type domain-containing protein n=1 Tax=Paraphoma chrysanthemicola TaxID=798071 RepID=A0A8K0R2X9_9PLEO|nr:hypothetical protein FB567DRAFT_96485 [Paraphoma chrysanthemicola]